MTEPDQVGPGFTQREARKRAKELDGIAISARRSPDGTRWIIGGWTSGADPWIVMSLDRTEILDDGSTMGGVQA